VVSACASPAPSVVVENLIAADNRGDLEAALASYTADVVWEPPNGPAVIGRSAIAQRYTEMFATFEVHLQVRIDSEEHEGSVAVVRGVTSGELRPRQGGAEVRVDDSFTARLVPEDGSWRINVLAWRPR
jgi:uncharacterized protein (TIGR02246 family)